jgi:hypothetical protein
MLCHEEVPSRRITFFTSSSSSSVQRHPAPAAPAALVTERSVAHDDIRGFSRPAANPAPRAAPRAEAGVGGRAARADLARGRWRRFCSQPLWLCPRGHVAAPTAWTRGGARGGGCDPRGPWRHPTQGAGARGPATAPPCTPAESAGRARLVVSASLSLKNGTPRGPRKRDSAHRSLSHSVIRACSAAPQRRGRARGTGGGGETLGFILTRIARGALGTARLGAAAGACGGACGAGRGGTAAARGAAAAAGVAGGGLAPSGAAARAG